MVLQQLKPGKLVLGDCWWGQRHYITIKWKVTCGCSTQIITPFIQTQERQTRLGLAACINLKSRQPTAMKTATTEVRLAESGWRNLHAEGGNSSLVQNMFQQEPYSWLFCHSGDCKTHIFQSHPRKYHQLQRNPPYEPATSWTCVTEHLWIPFMSSHLPPCYTFSLL